MAQVPGNFQPEPGEARCGNSFDHNLTVTGEIYGRGGFGSNLKHIIPRIALVPSGTWWSYRGDEEAVFVDRVKAAIARVTTRLGNAAADDEITKAHEDAIVYLLRLATKNLERIEPIYAFWDGNGTHPRTGIGLPYDEESGRVSEWPLPVGDAIYKHVSECTGVSGQWVQERQLVGNEVQTIRWYYCPSQSTRELRSQDREIIRKNLLDAARAVRCAEWGLWRVILYRKALAAWEEEHGGFGFKLPPKPPTPTPGLQPSPHFGLYVPPVEPPWPPGGGSGGGDDEPPPEDPDDFPLPDPDALPPPDAEPPPDEPLPGEEPLGPEGSGQPVPPIPPIDELEPPPAPPSPGRSIGPVPLPLAVGGAALALYFLTR